MWMQCRSSGKARIIIRLASVGRHSRVETEQRQRKEDGRGRVPRRTLWRHSGSAARDLGYGPYYCKVFPAWRNTNSRFVKTLWFYKQSMYTGSKPFEAKYLGTWLQGNLSTLRPELCCEAARSLEGLWSLRETVPGDSYVVPLLVVYDNPYTKKQVITKKQLHSSLQVQYGSAHRRVEAWSIPDAQGFFAWTFT